MNLNQSKSKNGFLVLLLDVIFVVAILVFIILEISKNPDILSSLIRALKQ